jgi:NlpC/P60 family putative phage cell wall peptidase
MQSPHFRAVSEARAWIGTPYRHQASLKGTGCDCLGLVRGVWRALYGAEPEPPPAYAPDWAEASGEERLAAAARRWLTEVPPAEAVAGDVLLFRWRPHLPAKHAAILSAPDRMIHAYDGAAVAEVYFAPFWRRRLAFAFRFPTIRNRLREPDASRLNPAMCVVPALEAVAAVRYYCINAPRVSCRAGGRP